MLGVFNTINIGGKEIYRGNEFALQRDYIYAGEITTCTGKFCADVVAWKYADLTIQWDNLPQDQLQAILDLDGQSVNMTFSNEKNETVTEAVIPTTISAKVTRLTDPQGNIAWQGIGLQLKFINAHSLKEA